MKQNLPPCLPYWFMLINLLINIPLNDEHFHKLKIHTVEMDLLTTGEGGGAHEMAKNTRSFSEK